MTNANTHHPIASRDFSRKTLRPLAARVSVSTALRTSRGRMVPTPTVCAVSSWTITVRAVSSPSCRSLLSRRRDED